jgi:hypothetical protein
MFGDAAPTATFGGFEDLLQAGEEAIPQIQLDGSISFFNSSNCWEKSASIRRGEQQTASLR